MGPLNSNTCTNIALPWGKKEARETLVLPLSGKCFNMNNLGGTQRKKRISFWAKRKIV